MAKPKGPHGDGGDGGEGDGTGVPRQRGRNNGRSTTIAETHQAVADAAANGRPGGPGTPDGRSGDGQGGDAETRPPQNDPALDKKDPQTLEEIKNARRHIQDQLQEMADESWDYVDQNKDTLLQREGYQRQREELIAKGYPEEVADTIVERTALGTEAHRHFANSIDSEADTLLPEETGFRLRTEVGYDSQGVETPRVKDQDFRPDVILERQVKDPVTEELDWEVAHAYDLKTGLKTGIENWWSKKVTDGLDLPEPPTEIRPTQRPLGG